MKVAILPLLAQLPTTGYVVQVVPVVTGVVVVEATPNSSYGAYQVTGYRPLLPWEIETSQAEFPGQTGLPTVDYVSACILQDTTGLDAAVTEASASLARWFDQATTV